MFLIWMEHFCGVISEHPIWLEIMPRSASKANVAEQLKKMLGCDRLVVFGDGVNDIDLFQIADEAYAVENAALRRNYGESEVVRAEEERKKQHSKKLVRFRTCGNMKKHLTT